MHLHFIGVSGTGMGALAGLLKQLGHRVTGSDTAFYPPMGDLLVRWGIEVREGFKPEHLAPRPDYVVIGNVCRRDNPEAAAVLEQGLDYGSMPATLERFVLPNRRSVVAAGTHGKTTTTSWLAYLLEAAGQQPGYLIGGVPHATGKGFASGAPTAPFVIEGDEYDSAFFEKTPKFWRYHPNIVVLTSIEHDHWDIYPDMPSYRAAFQGFIDRIPESGLLLAYAGDAEVRVLAKQARCRVRYYALEGDDMGDVSPTWLAAPAPAEDDLQPFDLYAAGVACGRGRTQLFGRHNLRNLVSAIGAITEGFGISVSALLPSLPKFTGIKRRQERVGQPNGINVYDDFAHHPTAVKETLQGLRARHPEGRLIAVYEPRSTTASRRIHQTEYATAFASSDLTFIAPVGRKEIAEADRLDVEQLAKDIRHQGKAAVALPSVDAIVEELTRQAKPGDTIAIMSNGAFGGIHARLLAALREQK